MSKWKLQAVEPDTCGDAQEDLMDIWNALPEVLINEELVKVDRPKAGCRYIELWNVQQTSPRDIIVVAFDRICAGHAASFSPDKMLWEDGNYKNKKDYIKYQREWFKHLNNAKWLVQHPNETMPQAIRAFDFEPNSPGSVASPPQIEIDGMNQAYEWNKEDNARKEQTLRVIRDEGVTDKTDILYNFEGHGDNRILTVETSSILNGDQKSNIQSLVDIQFGDNKVVIN